MTCREKAAMEHPGCLNRYSLGGVDQCPHSYGYLDQPDFCPYKVSAPCSDEACTLCWNREIPEEKCDDFNAPLQALKNDIRDYERTIVIQQQHISELEVEVKRLKDNLEAQDKKINEQRSEYDFLKNRYIDQQATIEKYEAIIRTVEAFVGQKILEE